MRKPLVLVVMPLYNAVQYVQKAVDSILNQTFKEFQLLIIDDGSTDGSYELVQGIKDPRVTVWKQENMGLCPTLNKGLRYAHENRIPYTARMDADDLSEPTRLEKQLALLEALPEKAACSSNCYYIDENDQIIGSSTVPLSPRLIRWEVQQGLRGMIHGATLFRTEALFS
ncbi:MAG: glycosyltransferase family A protein, partial [candidate division WOR-3 bacterium]